VIIEMKKTENCRNIVEAYKNRKTKADERFRISDTK